MKALPPMDQQLLKRLKFLEMYVKVKVTRLLTDHGVILKGFISWLYMPNA